MSDAAPSEAAFWDWSLTTYDRPGLADKLIALQDRFGLDVNILLWCAWAAASARGEIPELTLRKAIDLSRGWSGEIVQPLRQARRALKTQAPRGDEAAISNLRQSVKAAELAAEKVQQDRLDALAREHTKPSAHGAPAAARRSMAAYVTLAGAVKKPGFSTAALQEVIEIMFPEGSD